jgi:AraC-like DNA-binding protein
MSAAADSGALALSSIDVDVPAGTRHLALPSDLYAITVYCDDALSCVEEGEDFHPEVMVTLMRTAPGRFSSSGRGSLVIGLLSPHALVRVLQAPLDGLADRRVPLAHFCGNAEQRRLLATVRNAASSADRVRRLGHWIEQRLAACGSLSLAQRRAASASRLLTSGDEEVDTVAGRIGTSRRQLERDFRRWLGTSPAHLVRLVRFQRAVSAIFRGVSLANTAMDCDYADQAHLTRSLRGLTGTTPQALRSGAQAHERSLVRVAMAERLLISHPHDVALAVDAEQASTDGSSHIAARAVLH